MSYRSPSNHVIFGLMVAFCGLAIAWLLEDWTSFVITLLTAGAVGVIWLLRAFLEPQKGWSLCDFQGGALLSTYSIGTALSILMGNWHELGLHDPGKLDALCAALLFVLASSGLLSLLAPLERPYWRETIMRILTDRPDVNPVVLAVLVVTIFVFFDFVLNERVIFRNTGEKISTATFSILYHSMTMIVCWIGWGLAIHSRMHRMPLVMAALVFIPSMYLLLIGQGRLDLSIHMIVFSLLFFWRTHVNPILLISFAGLLGPMFLIGIMSFEAIRSFGPAASLVGHEGVSVLDYASIATNVLATEWDGVAATQITTLPARVFFLDYLSDLLSTEFHMELAYGREMLAQIIIAVPSVILPDKVSIAAALGGTDEERAIALGVIRVIDYPDSILTAAAMDFGALGPLMVGPAILILGMILALIIRTITCPTFLVMFFALVLTRFASVEKIFFTSSIVTLEIVLLFWPIALASGWVRSRSVSMTTAVPSSMIASPSSVNHGRNR